MTTTPDNPATALPGRPPVVDLATWQAARDELLVRENQVDGRGLEISPQGVSSCLARGLAVMQGDADGQLPWKLLGVHSARMDMSGRDLHRDETLGLNCAWYADILLTLTA